MSIQRLRALMVWLFLAVLLAGCRGPTPIEPTPSPALTNPAKTSTQSPALPHTPSLTDTLQPKPSATATQSALSPTPIRTQPPTATPTVTPYPTLAPLEMVSYIIDRMADNGGCELPCWWGVTPGETDWNTVRHTFESAGIEIDANGELGLRTVREETPGYRYVVDMMRVVFHHEDGLVQRIDINNSLTYTPLLETYTSLWEPISLHAMLLTYGVPSSVVLNLTTGSPDAGMGPFPEYAMWVVYENKGAAIRYAGLLVQDNDTWHLCPTSSMMKDIQLHLQPADATELLVDLESEIYDSSGYFSLYGNLDELSGMSSQVFYETFIQTHPQQCIKVPANEIEGLRTVSPPNLQTLSPSAENMLLRDLLFHNAGCELPCWWGITPGQTPAQEALSLFSSYSRSITIFDWEDDIWGTRYEIGIIGMHSPDPYDYIVKHSLYIQDDVVKLIGTQGHALGWPADIVEPPQHFTQDWERYLPPAVLRRYGTPDQILVHYWYEMIAPYSIALLYPEHGMVIEYMGITKGEKDADTYGYINLELCMGKRHYTDINIWLTVPESQGESALIDVFRQFGGGTHQLVPYNVTPALEQATGLSAAQFTRIFLDPDAEHCLTALTEFGDWVP